MTCMMNQNEWTNMSSKFTVNSQAYIQTQEKRCPFKSLSVFEHMIAGLPLPGDLREVDADFTFMTKLVECTLSGQDLTLALGLSSEFVAKWAAIRRVQSEIVLELSNLDDGGSMSTLVMANLVVTGDDELSVFGANALKSSWLELFPNLLSISIDTKPEWGSGQNEAYHVRVESLLRAVPSSLSKITVNHCGDWISRQLNNEETLLRTQFNSKGWTIQSMNPLIICRQ